jgi:hypothetical protein
MRLPFLDRREELERLTRLVNRDEGAFGVLYGRRRCGKSRLLREAVPAEAAVFFVGDDREAALQRAGLAAEIGRSLKGFDQVAYAEWDALLARWWNDAGPGSVLVLDEFPAMVARAGELPSVIQKYVDRAHEKRLHLLVAGSSQRMMQGLVLDQSAPLFGRATEILKITPLGAGWIQEALALDDPRDAVAAFAHWGGIPRYWELATDYPSSTEAVRKLVLDPLGVLYDEPQRLLLDDLRDTTQAASILSLIGRGCHRVSEIAARLEKPATSLSRPLQRLMEMELIERQTPFAAPTRGSKRTLYRIADPYLGFWFRFVEPNRSRLEARQIDAVERDIDRSMSHHVAGVWEQLARQSVLHLHIEGENWGPASRWWGAGLDREPLEVDLVAESAAGDRLLVGEVKWAAASEDRRQQRELMKKIERLPFVGDREVVPVLWLAAAPGDVSSLRVVTPQQVLEALR